MIANTNKGVCAYALNSGVRLITRVYGTIDFLIKATLIIAPKVTFDFYFVLNECQC